MMNLINHFPHHPFPEDWCIIRENFSCRNVSKNIHLSRQFRTTLQPKIFLRARLRVYILQQTIPFALSRLRNFKMPKIITPTALRRTHVWPQMYFSKRHSCSDHTLSGKTNQLRQFGGKTCTICKKIHLSRQFLSRTLARVFSRLVFANLFFPITTWIFSVLCDSHFSIVFPSKIFCALYIQICVILTQYFPVGMRMFDEKYDH